MAQAVYDRVVAIVESMAPEGRSEFGPAARLVEDVGLDSLRLMELLVALQIEFELEPFPEPELAGVATIADVVELVSVRVAA